MRSFALATLALLLAGCSGGSGEGSEIVADLGMEDPSATGEVPVAPLPTVEVVPISGSGDIGTWTTACESTTGNCQGQGIAARESDFFVERPGANFTGLDLTVTWDAASPATERLLVRAMVMEDWDGCEVCQPTVFDAAEGTSPLHYTLTGLSHALTEQYYVHILVLDPDAFREAGTATVGAYVGQSFDIVGNVTLSVPATLA